MFFGVCLFCSQASKTAFLIFYTDNLPWMPPDLNKNKFDMPRRKEKNMKLAFIGKIRPDVSIRTLCTNQVTQIIASPDREIDRQIIRFARLLRIPVKQLHLSDYASPCQLEQAIIDQSDIVTLLYHPAIYSNPVLHFAYHYTFDHHKVCKIIGIQFPRSLKTFYQEQTKRLKMQSNFSNFAFFPESSFRQIH